MSFPSYNDLSAFTHAEQLQLHQFVAYLQGYLSTEHLDTGAHGNVTAYSLTLTKDAAIPSTGNLIVGGTATITGALTDKGDIIANAGTTDEVSLRGTTTFDSQTAGPGIHFGQSTDPFGWVIVENRLHQPNGRRSLAFFDTGPVTARRALDLSTDDVGTTDTYFLWAPPAESLYLGAGPAKGTAAGISLGSGIAGIFGQGFTILNTGVWTNAPLAAYTRLVLGPASGAQNGYLWRPNNDEIGLAVNLLYTGSWNLDNTALPGWVFRVDNNTADVMAVDRASAGANPRSLTRLMTLDNVGTLTIAGPIIGSSGFQTSAGSVATTSGVAATMYTMSSIGFYQIFVWAGVAAYMGAIWVIDDGTNVQVIQNISGTVNLSLSVSGTSIQVTQTSGGAQTINWRLTKFT